MSDEHIASSMPEKPPKKDLPTGVKVLLRIVSILLCICLFATLLATVLIVDFRLMTSKDTIRKMAGSMFSAPTYTHRIPLTAAAGGLRLAEPSDTNTQTQEALVEWLYDTLKEQHGDDLVVTQEQMQTFLDQSTTKEYLTEKIASYMDDFINGTSNTTITTEELTWLIEENNAAIENELGLKMDEAAKEQVLTFVEEMNIGEVIRTEVIEGVENMTIPGGSPLFPENAPAGPDPENSAWGGSYTVGSLMADLRTLTSTTALTISIVVNILLIMALFFVNRMRLSATLCCTGIPMIVAGILLALPTALLQLIPSLLPNPLGNSVSVLVGTIAPVHYAVPVLGIILLIGAVVIKAVQKK
ncbi:MAG: hypothetical protein IJ422_08565 [Oscillospiraceae bacterium]|nr:hypothetical protein [Oscillospiraceae bacterium]